MCYNFCGHHLLCTDFFNWNRVKVRYCDGASFSGDSQNEVSDSMTTLFFFPKRIFFFLLLSLTYIMSISNYLVKLFFGNLWLQKTPFILWHDSKYYLTQPAGVGRGKTMVVGLHYYPGHTNHVCIVYDQLLQYNNS